MLEIPSWETSVGFFFPEAALWSMRPGQSFGETSVGMVLSHVSLFHLHNGHHPN